MILSLYSLCISRQAPASRKRISQWHAQTQARRSQHIPSIHNPQLHRFWALPAPDRGQIHGILSAAAVKGGMTWTLSNALEECAVKPSAKFSSSQCVIQNAKKTILNGLT